MSRKDFELIATTINGLSLSFQVKKEIAEVFAAAFAVQFPRFQWDKFVARCVGW